VAWVCSFGESGGWYPARRAGQRAGLPRSPLPHHGHQPPPSPGPPQPPHPGSSLQQSHPPVTGAGPMRATLPVDGPTGVVFDDDVRLTW